MQKRKLKILDYPQVALDFTPKIPPIKKVKDKTKINVRYCLISPFAYVHIYWDSKEYEVVYEIEEPILDKNETKYKNQLVSALRSMINFKEIIGGDRDTIFEYIDKRLKLLSIELGLEVSYETYKKIYYYLCRDFIGFNETEPLLRDYFIEDIECNGANSPIFIVHRIFRNIKTNLIFKNNEKLESFVEKLAQRCGKYISYAKPILDGSLPDGSRVNATYTKDITSKGPTFTIRKFTKSPWTPPQLIARNTMSPEMLAYLWLLVEYKMNLLVVGGTASGKTTLLNALAFFIPPEARVVSIEDTRELNLPRENWLPSVSRSATGVGGLGEIDLYSLLKASFRQNPDYVIVGEVRGKEASVLFQGMASGHSSIATIHADSVETVIKRLETPPIELSPTLLNVLDSICIMTHAMVNNQETRKLREIVEIINVDPTGVALTNTPFIWNSGEDKFYFKRESRLFQKIAERYGMNKDELYLEFRRRAELLYKMYQKKIFRFHEVQDLINEYYKKPKETLKKFQIQ
jgi:archaeal flagellar protein FlaI